MQALATGVLFHLVRAWVGVMFRPRQESNLEDAHKLLVDPNTPSARPHLESPTLATHSWLPRTSATHAVAPDRDKQQTQSSSQR